MSANQDPAVVYKEMAWPGSSQYGVKTHTWQDIISGFDYFMCTHHARKNMKQCVHHLLESDVGHKNMHVLLSILFLANSYNPNEM